eukprot:GHVT01023013.1.p1 GENE.GHVT01023013.1~~GHVT01023013.1.p1  ORF type:complete len:191 (+),score=24.90 GHVT01023013.1:410-982(+)
MATLIVHGTPHQLGHPSPQPSVKPIAARGRGEASPRPAPVRPPALVTPPSPTAIPKPPQDVDPTADAHDEVRPSQERAKCSEERLPLHADHRNTQRSISSLSSAIKKTPKLPKLPNAFSAKWNQQDVEDVDDAEFFEKYLVQVRTNTKLLSHTTFSFWADKTGQSMQPTAGCTYTTRALAKTTQTSVNGT